jgi:thymidylate synthase
MTITCVLSVTSKLGIGNGNKLLVSIPKDLERFKLLSTSGKKNAIIMGRKTFESLPRVLPGRVHIVFTNQKWNCDYKGVYFTNGNNFESLYKRLGKEYTFTVIGGSRVVDFFFNTVATSLSPTELYLTEIKNYKGPCDTFLVNIPECYKLLTYSKNPEFISQGCEESDLCTTVERIEYNFLNYKRIPELKTDEHVYLDTLKTILEKGVYRNDRTSVGTYSMFGHQMRFDISESFPLLTTKRVPFKSALEELLWFLRGDTDSNILKRKKVNIWNGNTSREFLDKRGLSEYPEGTLGPGYGWSMRFYNAPYNVDFSDTSNGKPTGGFDQIEYCLNLLKTDPMSRRIYMNYWNPSVLDETALAPCHVSFQFYVEESIDGKRYLSGHLYQRSMDTFLGAPWNIASYSLLLYIFAEKCDMIAKDLVVSTGDTHIYSNHINEVQTQLSREPRPFPRLRIHPSVKHKDFSEISVKDFDLLGYFPHEKISAPMAV